MSSLYGGTGAGSSLRGPVGSMPSNKVPSGYKLGRLQNFSPEQMDLFKSLFSNVSPDSQTSRLAMGDEQAFNQMEAPAMRQFAGLQGNIASRFSGMGTGGRHSSGFQNTIGQESSNFAQDLQSRRVALQRQAIQDLMGMGESLLGQRPYDQFLVQKPRSFLENITGGLAGGLGQAAGNFGTMAAYKKLGWM